MASRTIFPEVTQKWTFPRQRPSAIFDFLMQRYDPFVHGRLAHNLIALRSVLGLTLFVGPPMWIPCGIIYFHLYKEYKANAALAALAAIP